MPLLTKNKHYITDHPHFMLKGEKITTTYDLFEWAEWMEQAGKDRVVKQDYLPNNLFVSTVFLGIDYSFSFGASTPILFETMVFDENEKNLPSIIFGTVVIPHLGESLYQERYATYTQALKGHKQTVKKYEQYSRPTKRESKSRN